MSDLLEADLPAGVKELDLNIKLSEKGVMVINTDGTISQISNWKEMTEREQLMACRLISKRNEKRKALLKEEKAAQLEMEAAVNFAPGAGDNGEILALETDSQGLDKGNDNEK
jgi:hypothetical protein